MYLKRKFELLLVIFFFLFSAWLINKSFGYDTGHSAFRIARHQIGDFGLHLSLIRSFSWGNNYFPVESPFFPGQPLPYHYYFDFIVGMLEKVGIRIDIAFNGVSIIFFTLLLFLIYKLPQVIFIKSKLLGTLSVVLFLLHSNLTFIDFFKDKGIGFSLFNDLRFLPDYIHKGPFDGSIISIFFTLNVFLNQRHLITAMAISLAILYFLLPKLINTQKISYKKLLLFGVILGVLSRVHTFTFLSTTLIVFLLFLFFKRIRLFPFIAFPALLLFSIHLKDVFNQDITHVFINPGFLSEKPLTIMTFFTFWFANLGIAIVLIPLGFFVSNIRQKLVFLCVLPLFIIGNIFQLSFRIDHNHSLFNFFIFFANFYIAYFLLAILKKKTIIRVSIFVCLLFFLTISGFIDLMAVKNDFQFSYADAPKNTFMEWIKNNTYPKDVFVSKQEILDPVTLSGRKNYVGHSYYLSVMGYNYSGRLDKVKSYFEANSPDELLEMKKNNISYIVIPKRPVVDFNYKINRNFFDKNTQKVYQDNDVIVYKL